MRVSTRGSYLQGLSMMQKLQSALDHTQRQISSGRRILTPSDDPIASSRALEMREAIGRLTQFDRNSGIAVNRLSQEEAALNSVNNVLQRVRELALQANNATQSNESRQLIGVELRQQLDQLVQLANQKDGNGSYLFSGNQTDTQPVSRSGSNFSYNGDQGQRLIQIGEGRQVADGDSGAAVFFTIPDGNGTFSLANSGANAGTGVIGASSMTDPTAWVPDQYTIRFVDGSSYDVLDSSAAVVSTGTFQPGGTIAFNGVEFSLNGAPQGGDEFYLAPSRNQDMFSAVSQIIAAVELGVSNDPMRAAQSNAINIGILNLDQAIGNILDVRTQVGSRLSSIESQLDNNGAFALSYQDTLASIEDLDYAEAISRLSMESTTLEAAQQSFIRTQSLSLFNYF
ncbi:MAG TPA: flagellar hook-associated protein FlgL [Woeseiaceae bacterium]|nr:flagellar hook-associated protein FlgL [Woeseiaceae bacterium]